MATDSITKDLDELHRQAKSARRGLEPQWLMNLAFMQGRQWLAFGDSGLYEPPMSSDRIRVVENRVAGIVRTELAKMTKNRPVFVVTPNTGDEEDANAAQLAERLMRYMWEHLKLPELSLKALEWSRICGAGFLKCYWDSTIGEPQQVLVGPDGQVIQRGTEEDAQRLSQSVGVPIQSKTVAQGDVRVEARSPFQMFIDPLCDSFVEAEWLIEESVKSAEYVRRRYDVELKPDAPANPGLVETSLMGGGNMFGQGSYKGIKVREYWSKPSKDHPNGCRIVWAQGKILDRDERPFDPMPYVMLTGIPVPGRLWPMGIVDLLRGPQIELNKTLSQMAENRNRIANPTGLASKQAVQDPEKFLESISQPGGWHFYDEMSQHVPSYLEAPTLPDYVKEMPNQTRSSMEDISGQHEVTNAQVPPGVTAASAITLLQEADDTRLGLAIHDWEDQASRFGHKVLDLVSRFYTDARTIRIGGDDAAWEILDFRGANLRGNTQLKVEIGLPQSKAAQQAGIQDWMTYFVQSGNPPHGRQLAQFMRDSGMGSQARMLTEYTVNETQINRENVLLSLGKQLPINPYDDDADHIVGHEDLQKSPRYATFNPQVQQSIQAHVDAHKARQQEQEQAQQQAQIAAEAMAKGNPPPQMQGQQMQMDMQGQQQQQAAQLAQAQAQLNGAGQQQGYQAASQEQLQRHAQEKHEQSLLHAQQQHEMRLEQMRMQAQQSRGGGGGRT